MTKHIQSYAPTDSAELILKVIIDKNISQVPIFDDKEVEGFLVGIITEKTLMGKEAEGKSAKDVMDSKNPFPVVAKDTKQSVVIAILQ